jgi:hypothetical protein
MTDFDTLTATQQATHIMSLESIIKIQINKLPQITTKKDLFEQYKISEQYKYELKYYSLFPEHKKISKLIEKINLEYFQSILARHKEI